ncbi:hypothetical protein [Alkalicoccus daliensis]|uniref:hypothetical protein n=1 Tax=Alkalicoccus daliensis TaxID=745820 RepID=UPI00111308C3|nr:hypothetical protein [Alkalicoccus daliensis]
MMKAEGPVISGEISTDQTEAENLHQLAVVDMEKFNLELHLLFSVITLSLFLTSLFQWRACKKMKENDKRNKRVKRMTVGLLFSFLMAVLQYVIAGHALNGVFS